MQKSCELEYIKGTLRGMIHYPERGSGPFPAVMILHGFTGNKVDSHRMHVQTSRYLEILGYISCRFDFYGSGESDGDFDRMTLSDEIEQSHLIYEMLMRDINVDNSRIFVLGHSMGALAAAALAGDLAGDDDPAVLPAGLVLIAPAGNIINLVDAVFERQSEWQLTRGSVDHDGFPLGVNLRPDLKSIMALNIFKPRISRFRGPVLVIHGQQDITVPPKEGKTIADCYGDSARWKIISGADHCFSRVVYMERLFSLLKDFLTEGKDAS